MIGRAGGLGALAVALLCGVAACAGSAGPAAGPEVELARNAIPGLLGRRCDYASDHQDLPDLSRLARLGTRGNVALWGYDAEASDTAVLSIRYGDDGRLSWVRAIRSTLDPGQLAGLENLLRSSLNEQGPADWGVRLSVIGGDIVATEPSVICPVERRRGVIRTAVALPMGDREQRALEQARGQRFPVEISLDEGGRIVGVRLTRSSGDSAVDQFLLDSVLGTQFQPKLHDGIALATTIEQTLFIPRRR